jgi:hypothetical protein
VKAADCKLLGDNPEALGSARGLRPAAGGLLGRSLPTAPVYGAGRSIPGISRGGKLFGLAPANGTGAGSAGGGDCPEKLAVGSVRPAKLPELLPLAANGLGGALLVSGLPVGRSPAALALESGEFAGKLLAGFPAALPAELSRSG